MAYFEVQKALKEQEKAKQGKIFLTADRANAITEKVNNALSNKDISGWMTAEGYSFTGDGGLANLLKESYENFYKGVTPKEMFIGKPGQSYIRAMPKEQLRTQLGNLETAHMLRLKKAFENLEERMALKRKSDALKRKSDKLTLQRSSLARLKIDILKLIGEIDKK